MNQKYFKVEVRKAPSVPKEKPKSDHNRKLRELLIKIQRFDQLMQQYDQHYQYQSGEDQKKMHDGTMYTIKALKREVRQLRDTHIKQSEQDVLDRVDDYLNFSVSRINSVDNFAKIFKLYESL